MNTPINNNVTAEETKGLPTPGAPVWATRDAMSGGPAGSLKQYWVAMNATALDSAIHALVLFGGLAGAHAATPSVPALNLQQLAWLFLIAFGRAILKYVEAHPLAAALAEASRLSPAPAASDPSVPRPTHLPRETHQPVTGKTTGADTPPPSEAARAADNRSVTEPVILTTASAAVNPRITP